MYWSPSKWKMCITSCESNWSCETRSKPAAWGDCCTRYALRCSLKFNVSSMETRKTTIWWFTTQITLNAPKMGVSFSHLVRRIHSSGMYLVPCTVINDVRNTMVTKETSILRKLFNSLFASSKSSPLSCCTFPLEFLNSKWHSSVKKEAALFWSPLANERQIFLIKTAFSAFPFKVLMLAFKTHTPVVYERT